MINTILNFGANLTGGEAFLSLDWKIVAITCFIIVVVVKFILEGSIDPIEGGWPIVFMVLFFFSFIFFAAILIIYSIIRLPGYIARGLSEFWSGASAEWNKENFSNQMIVPNNLMSFYTDKEYNHTKPKLSTQKGKRIPTAIEDVVEPPYFSVYTSEEHEDIIKDINKPTSTELRDIENKLSRISDKLSLLINS